VNTGEAFQKLFMFTEFIFIRHRRKIALRLELRNNSRWQHKNIIDIIYTLILNCRAGQFYF